MTLLVVILLAAAALAWWGWRHAGSPLEYFVAGRRAGPVMVGLAGTAAGVSAFTFVGGPGLFAVAGVGSLWIILSAPLTGALQCWAVGEPIVAMAREAPLLTVPELIGRRLRHRTPHGVAAVAVIVGCVATLAVQAKASAVLGAAFLDVDGRVCAAVVMAATALYAVTGGMRTSLPAEALQGLLMGGIGLALAVAALLAAGGPSAAVAELAATRPELLGSFGSVPPARALGWFVLFCIGTCAQPHYLQKFLFLETPSALRSLPAVLTAALAVMLAVWLGLGLAGTALVSRGSLSIARPDDLAPAVVAALGPWAAVAAASVVLAAVMSTSASLLTIAAAAAARDLPSAFGRTPPGLSTVRLATAATAAAALVLGLASDRAVAVLGIMGWGFFTAALLPVLVVGLAWRDVTAPGGAVAIVGGAVTDLVLELQRAALPPGTEPGLVGAAVGTILLVAVSLATASRGRSARGEAPRAA